MRHFPHGRSVHRLPAASYATYVGISNQIHARRDELSPSFPLSLLTIERPAHSAGLKVDRPASDVNYLAILSFGALPAQLQGADGLALVFCLRLTPVVLLVGGRGREGGWERERKGE